MSVKYKPETTILQKVLKYREQQ